MKKYEKKGENVFRFWESYGLDKSDRRDLSEISGLVAWLPKDFCY